VRLVPYLFFSVIAPLYVASKNDTALCSASCCDRSCLFCFDFVLLYLEALLVETNNAVCFILSIFRKFFS